MTIEELRNGDTDYRLYKTITFDGGPMSYNEAFKRGTWQGWSHHKQIDIYCIVSNPKGIVLFPFADTKESLCYIENAETLEVYTHQDLIIKESVVSIQCLAPKDKTSALQEPNSIDCQRRCEIDNKINIFGCIVALLFMTRYPYLAIVPIIIMYFINVLSPLND
jgi:hypothetical protein